MLANFSAIFKNAMTVISTFLSLEVFLEVFLMSNAVISY